MLKYYTIVFYHYIVTYLAIHRLTIYLDTYIPYVICGAYNATFYSSQHFRFDLNFD